MHVPDLEADKRAALRVLDAAKLLVAYLEAGPSPPRKLSERLVDLMSDLFHPEVAAGAFPEAAEAAACLGAWVAKCGAAVEHPRMLEED
jgi:hypothetical protein